jgi:hypothetical protein
MSDTFVGISAGGRASRPAALAIPDHCSSIISRVVLETNLTDQVSRSVDLMMAPHKETKHILVIMPFRQAGSRNVSDLDEFYRRLKSRIESELELRNIYRVSKSDSNFDIKPSLVRELYEADIVLTDLSGSIPNPNVMYELGIRLAVTDKPVILFREACAERLPFDIGSYHVFEYSVAEYDRLESFIVDKLSRFELGLEHFRSPVLEALKYAPSVIRVLQKEKIGKTIVSAVAGVRGGLRNLSGCLAAYLKERDIGLVIPSVIEEFPAFIVKNTEALKDIRWKEFAFTLNEPPGISALLTDLPLDDFIGRPAAKVWNTILSEFHVKFYASDFAWRVAPWATVHNFIIQGTNLYTGLYALGEYITSDNPEHKEAAFKGQKEIVGLLSPKYAVELGNLEDWPRFTAPL